MVQLHIIMKKIFVTFSLALLVSLSLSPAIANAQFSIAPSTKNTSWLIYKIQAGEVLHDKVRVLNNDSVLGDYDVYPVDADVDAQGGFAPESRDAEKNTAGKWIVLKTSSVSIAPANETSVDLTISVPEDTKSGEYTGAIMVQKNQKEDLKAGINIATRVGVRVYITVIGSANEMSSTKVIQAPSQPTATPLTSLSPTQQSVSVETPIPPESSIEPTFAEENEAEAETSYISIVNISLTVLVFILLLFVLYNTKRRKK